VTFAPEPSSTGSGSQPTIQPVIPPGIIPPAFEMSMPWLDIYKGNLKPSSSPSTSPSESLSVTPSDTSTESPTNESIPPIITCPTFAMGVRIDFDYNRMCESGGCCDTNRRSVTIFCNDLYSFFGENMDSACWHCCDESKIVAPSTSLEVEPDPNADESKLVRRLLRVGNYEPARNPWNKTDAMDLKKKLGSVETIVEPNYQLVNSASEEEDALKDRKITVLVNQEENTPKNDEEKTNVLDERAENSSTGEDGEVWTKETLTDDEYFGTLMERHLKNENVIRDEDERRRRRLINYDDVSYWPYEWLVKVNTEYYFRYEGTQAVPPCKDKVHLRVMKDPIPIAPRQLAELERLLAERISPKNSRTKECELDNAGAVRPNTNGTLFDFARPTQKFHKMHRKVFCECKDWKSKFQADKAWCKRDVINRFYRYPYGFNPGSEFF